MPSNYDKICRLCLSTKEKLITIGSIFMLYDKIMQLTNIPLFDGDGLPSNVCPGCYKKITEFFKFREMCQSNFHILQKYHLLPHKPQDILDFIVTHVGFEDNSNSSANLPSTEKEIVMHNIEPINIQGDTFNNSLNMTPHCTNIVLFTNEMSSNAMQRNLTTTDVVVDDDISNIMTNIKIEQDAENYILIEHVQSIRQEEYNTINTTAECSSNANMITYIPDEVHECVLKQKEELTQVENMPHDFILKECSILLQDCLVDTNCKEIDKTTERTTLLRNSCQPDAVIKTRDKINRMSDSLNFTSNTSQEPQPNYLSSWKLRKSLPCTNEKFRCSLCRKTFISPEIFREHIKKHTLKMMFNIDKPKYSGFKFSNTRYHNRIKQNLKLIR